MSKAKNDPAFPVAENHQVADECAWTQGMTIRDYFAAQALIALSGMVEADEVRWARRAYKLADAMLEEREKRD